MREARNKPTRKSQVVVDAKKESQSEPLNLEIDGAFKIDEKKSKKKSPGKSKSPSKSKEGASKPTSPQSSKSK